MIRDVHDVHVVVGSAQFDDDLAGADRRSYGFRVDAIFPADAPADGRRLRPRRAAAPRARRATRRRSRLRLLSDDARGDGRAARRLHARVPRRSPRRTTCPTTSRRSSSRPTTATSGVGRAGMRYRDLIPDRWGGRFIASHITIPEGGPVPDYVHFHKIRFQMIFVKSGWVASVYEDQGEPFVMHAGDCVLQPPEIRHRVLESSPGLEVIEIGCPAEHETIADWALPLADGRTSTRPRLRRPAVRAPRRRRRRLRAVAGRRVGVPRHRHRRRPPTASPVPCRAAGPRRPPTDDAAGSPTTPSSACSSCCRGRSRSTPTTATVGAARRRRQRRDPGRHVRYRAHATPTATTAKLLDVTLPALVHRDVAS